MFDGGRWEYEQSLPGGPHVTKYFVEGPNSTHDIRLYINGNLTDELAAEYGDKLATFLNGPTELVNRIRELERQNLELRRVNNEQRLQTKRLEKTLDRTNPHGLPL